MSVASDIHLLQAAIDHLRSAKRLISMTQVDHWELEDSITDVIEALEHEEGEEL